jgi:hypothetical protein
MKEKHIYFAGLFDGEGWFRINRIKGSFSRMRRDWAYQCEAALVMRDKQIIEELHKLYGGSIREERPRKDGWSTTYKWRCSGPTAKKFAENILPWLIGKKIQAELLIKFQKEKDINQNRPLTDERYIFYSECFDQFTNLNKKGVGKK